MGSSSSMAVLPYHGNRAMVEVQVRVQSGSGGSSQQAAARPQSVPNCGLSLAASPGLPHTCPSSSATFSCNCALLCATAALMSCGRRAKRSSASRSLSRAAPACAIASRAAPVCCRSWSRIVCSCCCNVRRCASSFSLRRRKSSCAHGAVRVGERPSGSGIGRSVTLLSRMGRLHLRRTSR